jgi:hypothetical protein
MEVVQLDKSKGLSVAITLRWAVQNKSCEQSVAFRASVRLPHFIHGVDIASSRFLARNGPPRVLALRLLTALNRTSRGQPNSVENDPNLISSGARLSVET